MTKYFRIGKILKSQGIKGEAKVMPTTSDIKRFSYLKDFYLVNDDDCDYDLNNDNSYAFTSEGVKYLNDAVVLKIKNIDTISDIEKYKGYSIYIDKEDALELKDDEYYISDLIGMKVSIDEKDITGEVTDIMELKNQYNLQVTIDGKDYYIPFAKEYIKYIDLAKNMISINIVEGILDI